MGSAKMLRQTAGRFSRAKNSPSLFQVSVLTQQKHRGKSTDIDPAAAFPTAMLVAYWRAVDAASKHPYIGRNIGGGPDRLAETLAGSVGKEFAAEMASDSGDKNGAAFFMTGRTMFYDQQWMRALDEGCKQFVLLAAGLDTRAWRIPRLDPSIKVFELDVLSCFDYKDKKLAGLPAELTKMSCMRIPVEVDLSDPTWAEKLVDNGFDPTSPAFFLAEGLLMYLPPEAVPGFFKKVSSVACTWSTFAGCCFINCLAEQPTHNVLAKYGVKMIFETKSELELRALLGAAKFETTQVASTAEAMQIIWHYKAAAESLNVGSQGNRDTDEKSQQQAQKLLHVCSILDTWPSNNRDFIKNIIDTGGYRACADYLVTDEHNFLGMRDESSEQKKKVVELVMGLGLESVMEAAFAKADDADASPGEVDEPKAQQQAGNLLKVVSGLKSWPRTAVVQCWQQVESAGYRGFAKSFVQDEVNCQGLRDEPPAQKDRILEILMDRGFEAVVKPLFEVVLANDQEGEIGYVHFVAKKL